MDGYAVIRERSRGNQDEGSAMGTSAITAHIRFIRPGRVTHIFKRFIAVRLQTQAQLSRGALKRYLFIRKRLIFESSVRAGRPSLAAAPGVPEI
jgi:hypothetical protein